MLGRREASNGAQDPRADGARRPDKRYATLDAIRGIAALFIVARHFSDIRGPSEPPFSFLAVDLFFSMSGFVLSLSYLPRLRDGMTIGRFMVVRVVRLYPLYALGALAGLAVLSLSLWDGRIGAGTFAVSALSAVLAFPSPPSHLSPALFPYLVPAWSLFFEFFVANLLFALWARNLDSKGLLAIVAISGVALYAYASRTGSFDIGATWSSAIGGVPRVIFSFFAGVALQIFHRRHLIGLRIPSLVSVLSTVVLLSFPSHASWHFGYEAVCVFVLFPVLILLGAGSFERAPFIGIALGDVSYAIYTLHYPLLIIVGRVLSSHGIYPGFKIEFVFVAAIVSLSYVAFKYFDVPFRKLLRLRSSAFRPAMIYNNAGGR